MPARPRFTAACYACDAPAVGLRDRRPEGGFMEGACARHADPSIRCFAACVACAGPRPTIVIDGRDLWHKRCHEQESA